MLRWSLACSGVVVRVRPEDASCAGEGGSPAVMGAEWELELKLPHTVPLHGAEMPRLYTSASITHETGLRGRL